jgi:hypothetical protein
MRFGNGEERNFDNAIKSQTRGAAHEEIGYGLRILPVRLVITVIEDQLGHAIWVFTLEINIHSFKNVAKGFVQRPHIFATKGAQPVFKTDTAKDCQIF